jgi:3-hydroxyacyl-CoA dehydrogenase
VASLAGVGLFAETHAGTMARRIAVVPLSDAGPALASVAVIFEAVPEVLDFNEMVGSGIDACGPQADHRLTTSTMTVDEMAGEVERPARVLNAHWLNQAYLVQLVELSPGVRMDGAILAKRSRPSSGTACATCARSSTRTICTATERSPRARSASWRWVMRSGSPG